MEGIKVGDEFYLANTEDPWAMPEGCLKVKVLDLKDGWVRYYIGDVFPDNRRPIKDFLAMYKKVE